MRCRDDGDGERHSVSGRAVGATRAISAGCRRSRGAGGVGVGVDAGGVSGLRVTGTPLLLDLLVLAAACRCRNLETGRNWNRFERGVGCCCRAQLVGRERSERSERRK